MTDHTITPGSGCVYTDLRITPPDADVTTVTLGAILAAPEQPSVVTCCPVRRSIHAARALHLPEVSGENRLVDIRVPGLGVRFVTRQGARLEISVLSLDGVDVAVTLRGENPYGRRTQDVRVTDAAGYGVLMAELITRHVRGVHVTETHPVAAGTVGA